MLRSQMRFFFVVVAYLAPKFCAVPHFRSHPEACPPLSCPPLQLAPPHFPGHSHAFVNKSDKPIVIYKREGYGCN